MNWLTVIWGILIGGCIALALPHLLVGIWLRRASNLFFVSATVGVVGIAIAELLMMDADSVEAFCRVQRWTHLPIFILYVSLVWFVRLYFGAGRLWLAWLACATRLLALVVNFTIPACLNFREITALQPVEFFGRTVSTPVGIVSPWTHLGELCSALLLIFVIDASITAWRAGRVEKRRILVVAGSITVFILLAASDTALIHNQIVNAPYLVSFPFAAILLAMGFELGSDLFRAGQVAQKLRRSEASLQESEARFRSMADSAPVLIWMAGPDKLCTFLNKAWLAFTGRRLEQELGNGWAEGVHPDDFDRCLLTYHEAFDRREPFTIQYRLRRYDGVYRVITDEGVARYGPNETFRGYIGACLDITDSIEREKALREIEERVGLAAEAAQLAVWELDTVTGEIWLSDKARELFQFQPDEKVTYEDFKNRVHPEDRARRDAAIDRAIQTRSEYEIEYRVQLPNGTMRWMTGRGRCITDDDGKTCRLLAVSMDVTNRKIAEEEARSRRQQVELLSRVSLLGEMTASIAHELNQPLTAIMSNANAGQRFIERGIVDPETLREILIDVAAEGRRAHNIVQNIRDTIKKGTVARHPVDMNQLVKNVTHLIEPNAAVCACEIQTSLAPDLPEVEGDPVQLQQVLINLITNACEAMAEVPAATRKVNIATEQKNTETIGVSVRDFGTGIPSEARSRLFEQFFTTKTEGLGMGLAIVRSIVEAHGGQIIAENVNNGGARFHFSLPIANNHKNDGNKWNGFRD